MRESVECVLRQHLNSEYSRMFSLVLASLISSVAAYANYSCSMWNAVADMSPGYTGSGLAQVFDNATGAYFVLTNAIVNNGSTPLTTTVVAHVHVLPCSMMDASIHFKVDTTQAMGNISNELWGSPSAANTPSTQSGAWSSIATLPGYNFGNRTSDLGAIIIHEILANGSDPRRICCGLAPVSSSNPSPAGTTAAGATTTAAAAACTTATCCSNLLNSTSGPCTGCLSNSGCTYYGLLGTNNNVISSHGGKCVLTSTAAMTGYSLVNSTTQCADACGLKTSCTACYAQTAATCLWCDAGATVASKLGLSGITTGSCELKSCPFGASTQIQQAKCGASSLSAAFAAVVAVVAALMF